MVPYVTGSVKIEFGSASEMKMKSKVIEKLTHITQGQFRYVRVLSR